MSKHHPIEQLPPSQTTHYTQEPPYMPTFVPVHNNDGFFIIFACFGAWAVYHFGLRPLLVTGVNAKALSTKALAILGTLQSFVLSKWTWIVGILVGMIVGTYMFDHLWYTVAALGLLALALDKLFYTVPNTTTVVGGLEAQAKDELNKVILNLNSNLANVLSSTVSNLQVKLAAKESLIEKLVAANPAAAAMIAAVEKDAATVISEVH